MGLSDRTPDPYPEVSAEEDDDETDSGGERKKHIPELVKEYLEERREKSKVKRETKEKESDAQLAKDEKEAVARYERQEKMLQHRLVMQERQAKLASLNARIKAVQKQNFNAKYGRFIQAGKALVQRVSPPQQQGQQRPGLPAQNVPQRPRLGIDNFLGNAFGGSQGMPAPARQGRRGRMPQKRVSPKMPDFKF